MTMTDPIASMLTVIRNANAIRLPHANTPLSKEKVGLAAVLKEEGYIHDFSVVGEGTQKKLRITLKYGPDGERLIRNITRRSKPGCRSYCGVGEIPKVLNGLGISILSTPKGILSDRKAREARVGGELLCTVY